MTNNTDSKSTDNTDDAFKALETHIESITSLHRAAWRGPVVRDYTAGAVVWIYDHYNTGVIAGAADAPDTWTLTTTDADGAVKSFRYKSAHLRPAAMTVEFRWGGTGYDV